MLRAGVCISLKPGQEAMSIKTRDEYRFTVSEVTADWYELMEPQYIMWSYNTFSFQAKNSPFPQIFSTIVC